MQQLRQHTSSVYAIAVSPDGALLASGGGDDVAVLWDVATMKPLATLRGHTDSVVAVAWSYTGSMLATAGLDSTVRVWDRAGALLHAIEGPSAEVEWLSWHPKGDVLLAGRCAPRFPGPPRPAPPHAPARPLPAVTTRLRGCGT